MRSRRELTPSVSPTRPSSFSPYPVALTPWRCCTAPRPSWHTEDEPGGWSSGTYTFALTLETVDPVSGVAVVVTDGVINGVVVVP